MTDRSIAAILSKFRIEGEVRSVMPFGSGHINDTYRVNTTAGKAYLLQRINHLVFKNVPGLMNNLVIVTERLRKKLIGVAGADPEKEVLSLINTKDGGWFTEDESGNSWRIFNFLDHTKSYDLVTTEKQAFEGGKAFGRFQALLADLDARSIVDTIPDFHNITSRLSNLDSVIAANPVHRVTGVSPEIAFINQRRKAMSTVIEAGRAGLIPQRIIHNDTKFNNVLLDEHDRAQCVIDLDTVMPGYVAYDFGDAIRTVISTAAEDEADIGLIGLNIPLFSAYVKGYLEQAAGFLTGAELDSLMAGALLLPYMQGVRFLTDHLDGDHYFKIHSPGHNLQRARAQFQLVKKLEAAKEELNDIILNMRQDAKK